MPKHAVIALGANLGDASRTVESAIKVLGDLPDTALVKYSSLYASAAVGPPQPDYINAAVLLETDLTPHKLLDNLQALEQASGREQKRERWGPRTLDLDIIIFADEVLDDERLTIPHPEAWHRCFVLAPMAEIDPTLNLSGYGDVAGLLKKCDTGATRKIETGDRQDNKA